MTDLQLIKFSYVLISKKYCPSFSSKMGCHLQQYMTMPKKWRKIQ